MKRREFLEAGLAAGAGVVFGSAQARAAEPTSPASPSEELHVALIGAGMQGRALMTAALGIPGIRFRAICDVWKYARRTTANYLETYKQQAADYADYRELLAKEKGLQAVIVATPDFLHAEHANACLKAGLHVYCEKAMATTLDAARSMVRTMRETGKLLQIGYQRRSNPRYRHVWENLLQKAKLTGRLTHMQGQWYHPVRDDAGWPKKFALRDEDLQPWGYAGMHELRNWRFFKRFGGGPFADFGAHQADVAGWFLGAAPKSILATGGVDYHKTHQWADNVTAILEYELPEGTVRATLQVQTTTSGGGESSAEHFMGADGSVKISENAKWTKIFREVHASDWDPWVRAGYLARRDEPGAKPATSEEVHVRETGVVVPYDLPIVLDKPIHQPHLENFFDSVRGKAQLNCPADEAFRTEVIIHKVNEAMETRKLVLLAPEDFRV